MTNDEKNVIEQAICCIEGWINACGPCPDAGDLSASAALRTLLKKQGSDSEPVARVNRQGFIVEMDDIQMAEGTLLYMHPAPVVSSEPVAIVKQWANTAILDVTGLLGYSDLPDGTPLYSHPAPVVTEMERVEPVGRFVHQDFGGWQQVAKEFEHHTDTTPLYTHPQDRDSIIEECAAVCESFDERYRYNYGAAFADAIRALKGKK